MAQPKFIACLDEKIMNAQDLFAAQLAQTTPYTSEMLHAAVESGLIKEGSDAHQYRLGHIGERPLFVMVHHTANNIESGFDQSFKIVVEMFFESELSDYVRNLNETHVFSEYTGVNMSMPRFRLKPMGDNNVAT